MAENIIFEKRLDEVELISLLREISFRGLYDENGNPIKPYKNAKFSLVKVVPPEYPTSYPQIMRDFKSRPLFTAQPTIYKSQIDMLMHVDEFLKTQGKRIHNLGFEAFQYDWEGRGRYHVLPPIIEKHVYDLNKGYFDLKKIASRFEGCYVKDAIGQLHPLSKRFIRDYYLDEESKISYLDIFNHNASLINYGMRFSGESTFYIICDGSHRMDLALEILNEPISAILVESDDLLPYYAFPMPFRPTTRLTSKEAEAMFPKLERDKVHLLNDHLKKVLHYDWVVGGLYVSKLRSNAKIH
ncbi:MAG TPA: hypothetical protein VJI68_02960 [Candidatus Nanoarchaeia archaeon]|nr:hypothetical protein [Candidatus Nanoarchaeia archaeon]